MFGMEQSDGLVDSSPPPIHRACKEDWITTPHEPHYDILLGIETEVLRRYLKFKGKWICSHAEQRTSSDRFTRTELLNVQCDAGTRKKALLDYTPHHPRVGREIYVVAPPGRLVKQVKTALVDHSTMPPIVYFWKNNFGWANGLELQVAWEALGKARRLTPQRKHDGS